MKATPKKNPKKLRINSVFSPCAVSTTQCDVVLPSILSENVVLEKIEELRRYGLSVHVVASLQLRYACRIGEILNIKYSDIDPLGRIIIRGSKGSHDKVIDAGEWREQFLNFRRFRVNPFDELNYDFVYRCYKSVGLSFSSIEERRKKVTHSLRYAGIKLLSPTGLDIDAKQQLSGHKNKKNTQYYESKTIL